MARVAVLQGNSFGEYEYAETTEYDGTLNEYLADCDGVEIEVCPEGEEPVTHNCQGATILRATHTGGPDGTYHTYEAFWADDPGAISWQDLRTVDANPAGDYALGTPFGQYVERAMTDADRAEQLAQIEFDADGSVAVWHDWFLVPEGTDLDSDDLDLSDALDGYAVDWTGCRETVEEAIAAHADEE